MNKKSIKELLKPIIKECLTEVLVENGINQSVSQITESLMENFMSTPRTPARNMQPSTGHNYKEQMNRDFQRMTTDAFGETTQPIKKSQHTSTYGPLSGMDDDDAGVDISMFFGE